MDLNVSTSEQVVRTVTVAPKERIDAFSAPALRSYLDGYYENGVCNFIIDLTDTPFLDSAGMAVFVSLLKRCRQAGGDVSLVWPNSESVRRILRLTRFDRVFVMLDAQPS